MYACNILCTYVDANTARRNREKKSYTEDSIILISLRKISLALFIIPFRVPPRDIPTII